MSQFTPEELKEILVRHAQWLRKKASGNQATFKGVDLSGANLVAAALEKAELCGAMLAGADLSSAAARSRPSTPCKTGSRYPPEQDLTEEPPGGVY